MKWDDRPLWYDVVTAFPPKEEPRYDRPAPNVTVRPIFYAEDKVRAKFQSSNRTQYITNMSDLRNKTPSQHFIEIHQQLAGQGALDSERVFETAQELLEQKLGELRQEKSTAMNVLPAPQQPEAKGKTVQLQDIFKE